MSITIIYHKNCMDGILSGYAAWKVYQTWRPMAIINLLPMNHGDNVPLIHRQDKVIIVDFSLPLDQLQSLQQINKEIVLIDHHETAINALKGKFETIKNSIECRPANVILEKGRAGCMLTWEHFHPDTPIPGLFSYAADRDLWQWQLYKSKEINAALRQNKSTYAMEDIDKLIAEWDPAKLAKRGTSILAAQNRKINSIAAINERRVIAGHEVPCILNSVLISEVCSKLLELNPDVPFTACYFIKQDGKYNFSLRSRSDFDCSEVAKSYGGGGHKQASGFDIASLEDLASVS